MITLNTQVSFIYGWYSLRFIKVFVDDKFHSKILAQGFHELKIPANTKKVTYTLGFIKPYNTSVSITEQDVRNGELFVGLYLHHRSLLLSLYHSLKQDYLRSIKLTKESYQAFTSDVYQEEKIVLKDKKIATLTLVLSLLVLIFSVIQQQNEWAPLAFMLGLSLTISTLVYFKETNIEKTTFKTRVLVSIVSFALCALFLDNSFYSLRFVILVFSLLLFAFYLKEMRNRRAFI